MCIPNSTTEVWTVIDVDLLLDIRIQLDQHVSSEYMYLIVGVQSDAIAYSQLHVGL